MELVISQGALLNRNKLYPGIMRLIVLKCKSLKAGRIDTASLETMATKIISKFTRDPFQLLQSQTRKKKQIQSRPARQK